MIFYKELNRENVEWSNTWIDNARNFDCSRILLIGGSGAREFRSSLSKQLHGYAVDFIGTSSSLNEYCVLYHTECFSARFSNLFQALARLYRGGYATLEQYILKIKWLWGIFKITHNRKFTCYYIFGLRIKKNIRK